MAELQLRIPYKTSWSRLLFWVMCALFPLWAVLGPAALGILISTVILHPQNVPLYWAILMSLSMVAFTVISIALTALAEDNCIYISKDGLAFPPFFLPKLKYRRNRSWTELKSAHVSEGQDNSDKGKKLLLSFEEGAFLPLNLSIFKDKDLEQVFLAVELWGNQCKRSPQLIDYQKQVQNKASGANSTGYTKLWEDELRRRFSTTAFMPLEPDHILQSGRLKVVRQLAFGGLSAIYLAQENGLDLVVVKEAVVPPGADETARQQAEQILSREAKMLSQLRHSNMLELWITLLKMKGTI